MRKKKCVQTISLPRLENQIVEMIKRNAGHGWFSNYVTNCIRKDLIYMPEYRPNVERALKTILGDKNAELSRIESERDAIITQIINFKKQSEKKIVENSGVEL